MIAKSDVIILVVSASALAAGIYRWQSNMAMISTAQRISSAPTAAVLDRKQSTANAMASATQPGASTAVATNSTVVTGNTAKTPAPVNGAVVTGNTANNGTRIISVSTNNNTAAVSGAGNANQPAIGNKQATGPLYGSYIVKSGDYLGKIAETYGTTVAALRSINNITGSLIDIDQEILYPLPAN